MKASRIISIMDRAQSTGYLAIIIIIMLIESYDHEGTKEISKVSVDC